MMLQIYGPCGFGQKDFWKLHFENLFFTLWPTYAINQNHLNYFGRVHPGIMSVEFGKIPISSLGEVIWSFPCIIPSKIVTPGPGLILTPWA